MAALPCAPELEVRISSCLFNNSRLVPCGWWSYSDRLYLAWAFMAQKLALLKIFSFILQIESGQQTWRVLQQPWEVTFLLFAFFRRETQSEKEYMAG